MSAATGPLPERVPVLVIDDDEIVRTWVKHSLDESEFYVLESAETAAEAERALQSARPALLLVDYRLPDVDGIELVRRLRRSGVTTPAVLMTAATQAGLNHAAVEAGFQGAYVKSGRREPLLEALRLARSGDPAFDHRNPRPESNGRPEGDDGVLDLVTRGFTTNEVAERTGISPEAALEAFRRASGKIHRRQRGREPLRPVPDPEPAPPAPSKDLAYTERAAVLAAFLRSVGETVDGLRRELAELAAAPAGTASGEALATYAHTLKGGASTAGLDDIAALAAQLEATAETSPLGTDELRRLAVVSRELDVRVDRLPAPDTVGLAVRPRRTVGAASTFATVAYVDDDPASLKLVEVLLAREPGFRLVTARSGHDGVAAIERERPDLVFLDLRLPDIDGLEVLERLRALERGEELPIVLLTGEAGGRLPSLQQAADLVLTKPLDLGRFFEIVALLREEAAAPPA